MILELATAGGEALLASQPPLGVMVLPSIGDADEVAGVGEV
jgi:hypothetical protein